MEDERTLAKAVAVTLSQFDRLPPDAAPRADYEISWQVLNLTLPDRRNWLSLTFGKPLPDVSLLGRIPELEHLFLFHRNGRLRQAALEKLDGAVRSPFFLSAIALRMNDCVPQVRKAAVDCAARAFPVTSPLVIAGAAEFLIDRYRYWQRWDSEAETLNHALHRPNVADTFAERLIQSDRGPAARLL